MDEEMNQAEVARDETEEKMVYKFLYILEQSIAKGESLEQVKEKVEAMLKK